MSRLLWLLALAALAAGISLAARFNDGYLLLVLPPYRAEISLNLTIILLLLAFVVLYAGLRAAVLTVSLPQRARRFRARRRDEKAAAACRDALRLLFEGRFGEALKKAEEAQLAGASPGLVALLAARAAQGLGDKEKATAWLDRASLDDPRLEEARLMLEAEMHLDAQRFAAALATLQRLQHVGGRHIAVLRLELRAQQGGGNWNEVLRLTRLLEERAGLAPELTEGLRRQAHRENIRRHQGDLGQLLAYLQQLPVSENSPDVARILAEALLVHAAHEPARALLEAQLDRQWDAALLGLYGQLPGPDLVACIARAEAWLPEHPADPHLLLALGRLCLKQRWWGKAQSYLEASLSLADRRPARLALARLFEQTARPDEALPHYRAAAEQPA
ncbi:MAG: heme biosynthesis HemY N-terminal domain-containing protein [Candidatus Accumulibacter sp. UW20]